MQEKTPIFDEIFETLQKKPVMKVWVAYRVGGLTDSSGKNRNEILKPSFDILLSSTIPWLSPYLHCFYVVWSFTSLC